MMLPGIEIEILWPEESHRAIGRLFIAHVPPHNCRINEWHVASLFGIILPNMTKMGNHQPLVSVDGRSASGCCAC
jgi:hypothetical protein